MSTTNTAIRSGLAGLAVVAAGAGVFAKSSASSAETLEEAYNLVRNAEFVDLTHAFGPNIPHWKGFEPEDVKTLYTIEKDGVHADRFSLPGQWGTHVDPPAHDFCVGILSFDILAPG